MNPTHAFSNAREFLLRRRTEYDAAMAEFRWPRLPRFNWAVDWFDEYARGNTRTALRIVHDGGDKPREVSATFADLSERSTRVANWLHGRGVAKGDRILVMLPNPPTPRHGGLLCVRARRRRDAILRPTAPS